MGQYRTGILRWYRYSVYLSVFLKADIADIGVGIFLYWYLYLYLYLWMSGEEFTTNVCCPTHDRSGGFLKVARSSDV